jgi:hypothetical protein
MPKTKERPILKDPNIFPSAEVLKDALGKSYTAYEKLMAAITDESVGLDPQWNYYKDGGAWLCKIVHKKTTVIWLSVWETGFKLAFYFNERTAPGVYDLDIPQDIKDRFTQASEGKKFKPLVLEVGEEIDMGVVMKIVEYKKKAK